MITFSNKLTSSTPLFQSLCILPISNVNILQICVFVYQSIHKLLPICFHSVFQFNSQIHNFNTRSANNLHPNFSTTTFSQFSVSFRGPHFWNTLPVHIRNCTSVKSFKKQTIHFLLAHLNNATS